MSIGIRKYVIYINCKYNFFGLTNNWLSIQYNRCSKLENIDIVIILNY